MEDQRECEQRRDQGESSAALAKDASLQWPSLWKFQCQPKIKQFLWTLAHNSLSFRSNINRRGVKDVDTRCPVCKRLDEDRGHCFLKCKAVKKCWQALNLEQIRLRLLSLSSSRDVVQHVLELKGEERVLVPCFLWAWWDVRNKANAGEGMMSTEEVQHKAMQAALNAKLLQRLHPRQGSNSRLRQCSWQPPQRDVPKINIDVAYRAEEKDGAWGFNIRDSNGCGVLAGSGKLSAVHDALSAEPEACVAALHAAMDVGISHVVVETLQT
jgi:hypothetical protein